MRKISALLLMWGALWLPINAASMSIGHTVTPNIGYVGDEFHYLLKVQYPENVKIIPPAVGLTLGEFKLKNQNEETKPLKSDMTEYQLSYTLTSFDVGDHYVPTQTIFYMVGQEKKSTVLPAIRLTVKSLLNADTNFKDLRPVKPPIHLSITWAPYLKRLAVFLLLIGMGAAVWQWYKRRQPAELGPEDVPIVDTRTPWEKATEALEGLVTGGYLESGDYKLFYYHLTEIIKGYFSDVFDEPILEMTTYETLAFFDSTLDEQGKKRLKHLLDQSDLVKFANQALNPEDHSNNIDRTRWLIDFFKTEGTTDEIQ